CVRDFFGSGLDVW
nr:immunoglobulin heavy chain junction region [Macaca mulatta]